MLLLAASCNTSINKILTKKTPHEAYAKKIEDDTLGPSWIAASQKALVTAQPVELPYKIAGNFQADKPRALAFRFKARQGQRIKFEISKTRIGDFILFADLYRQNGVEWQHILAVDTIDSSFTIDADETSDYLVRIQPGLNQAAQYELTASVSPSLGFPVAGNKARIGSFWGDDRDAGKRNHEGIDIFAAKRTPVVAGADGYITRVAEGGIGGRTVWMRATGEDIHLYYAHLDTQLVNDGQRIKKGDTLGLVGNTGNARFTPSHLHFGVYTSGGPIDPLPFVDRDVKIPADLVVKNLDDLLVVKKPRLLKDERLKEGMVFVPLALTKNGYIGELAGGDIVQVPVAAVAPLKKATTHSQRADNVNSGS